MSEKLNLHNPENAKKLAKKVSKVTDISHSEALNLIAKDLGFTDWHHYLKVCGSNASSKKHELKLKQIPIDVEFDNAVFTGLYEDCEYQENSDSYRFRIGVDSKTCYNIDQNADLIINWLRKYSEGVEYRFVFEMLEIERGFPVFGFSLDFYLTTCDRDEAKTFANDFFSFLNSLSM